MNTRLRVSSIGWARVELLARLAVLALGFAWFTTTGAVADEPVLPEQVPGQSDRSLTDRELYSRAASALLAKNIQQATVELSQLIQSHPESELAPLAAIRLAECHLASSKWTDAIVVLDQWMPELSKSTQARTLEPASLLRAQSLLGRAYLMNGQYAQLNDLYEAQKAIYPDRMKLSEAESKAFAQLDGLVAQAKQKQEEAQAVVLRAAAAAVKEKQFAVAQTQLDQVIESLLSPAWLWRYQVLRAQCSLGQNDPQATLDVLAAIKLSDLVANEQAAVHMVRLDAAIALGKLSVAQESIETLQKLTGEDPRQGASIALRAVEMAMLRKDRQTADQLALDAKTKFAKFESLHEFDLLLARNALAKIEFAQARTILNSILQSPPASDPTAVPRARWLLGESHLLAQDYPQAIREYTQVIETNQPSAWMESSLMQRGKCYQRTGEVAQAIEDYRRLAREYPRSALRSEALQQLQELGAPEAVELNANAGQASETQPLKEAAKDTTVVKPVLK